MRERSKQFEPHRLVDLVFCFDQNSLRLDLCSCFNHQFVEAC
jgi:hypothetical protein